MINIESLEKCCGCSACSNICPKNAIEMQQDEEGFVYPKIDNDKCIDCQLCDKICPVNIKRPEGAVKAFGAYNLNEKERLQSSSGGIFTLLAKAVLADNGVVVGAAFDDNLKLSHTIVEKEEDLYKVMGSKYLQSNIEKCYKAVEENLKNGIKVLFSGTPCQIAGIKSYLQKEYDNLYLVDIICHGAPSPKVFDIYKSYLEKKYKSEIKEYQFRAKPYGWRLFENRITFKNGKVISENLTENLYMRCFLKNAMLRPSCHDCAFKTIPKDSCITLADFWGINRISDFKDDNKGLSLILVNNEKGQALLDSIRNCIYIFEVDSNESIKLNPSAVKSSALPCGRKEFLEDLTLNNFKKKAYKILGASLKSELKIYIKSILKKIKK